MGAITLHFDPAPRIVRYLRDRFRAHKTADLPDDLQVTSYSPLGKERPRLIVSYNESSQQSERGGQFVVGVELRYEPEEYERSDDGTVSDLTNIPEQMDRLYDLMVQFLSDPRIDEAGFAIEKPGLLTTGTEQDDNASLALVIIQQFQAFARSPR